MKVALIPTSQQPTASWLWYPLRPGYRRISQLEFICGYFYHLETHRCDPVIIDFQGSEQAFNHSISLAFGFHFFVPLPKAAGLNGTLSSCASRSSPSQDRLQAKASAGNPGAYQVRGILCRISQTMLPHVIAHSAGGQSMFAGRGNTSCRSRTEFVNPAAARADMISFSYSGNNICTRFTNFSVSLTLSMLLMISVSSGGPTFKDVSKH